MQIVYLGEAVAALRRVYFNLVDATDGFTPEIAEAGGQPNYSLNGAFVGNTAGVLVVVDAVNQPGCYYVTLSAAEIAAPGKLLVRYKSAATRECVATAHVSTPPSTYFGTVVADGGNSAIAFLTDLGDLPDLRDSQIVMLTGATAKQTSCVTQYDGVTGFIYFNPMLAAAPAAGDTFAILPATINSKVASAASLTSYMGQLVSTTGTVQANIGNTASTFRTDLGVLPDLRGSAILMRTGATYRQCARVISYSSGTGFIAITPSLSATPAATDAFSILPAALFDMVALTGLVTTVGAAGAGLTAITGTMALDATVAKAAQFVAEAATVNDVTPTTSSFITTLASAVDDFYVGAEMSFTTGPLTTAPPTGIAAYVAATKRITLMRPLPVLPANGNTFVVERDIAATLSVGQNIGV